ncbi:MAG: dockerin type I domain-containing protein, partial [Oscillospiraceae bacterium]|nr:dockerin type I domain-containing protein [Oscillospiraceae bacterium]
RFTTVGGTPGDLDGDDKVTLIDLSEIIDAFGVTSASSAWVQYRFFDFNGNNAIDIQDIVEIALKVN